MTESRVKFHAPWRLGHIMIVWHILMMPLGLMKLLLVQSQLYIPFSFTPKMLFSVLWGRDGRDLGTHRTLVKYAYDVHFSTRFACMASFRMASFSSLLCFLAKLFFSPLLSRWREILQCEGVEISDAGKARKTDRMKFYVALTSFASEFCCLTYCQRKRKIKRERGEERETEREAGDENTALSWPLARCFIYRYYRMELEWVWVFCLGRVLINITIQQRSTGL